VFVVLSREELRLLLIGASLFFAFKRVLVLTLYRFVAETILSVNIYCFPARYEVC